MRTRVPARASLSSYLWLFGTGMRGAGQISCTIGNTVIDRVKVQRFDTSLPGVGPAQPLLDYISIEISHEIAVPGAKQLVAIVDGRTSNVVSLQFR